MEFITSIEAWHWLGLGLVLLIVELLAPATFFLWFAIAAFIVAMVSWIIPDIAWQIECCLFAILSVGSLVGYRMYLTKNPIQTDAPTLNRRGEQYIDDIYVLEDPIVNGFGKIKIGDTAWKVKGVDAERGTRVKVIAVDGIILKVELLED